MRRETLISLGAFALACVSSTAHATFHLMRISEVLTHAGGDPRIQAVELEMTASGQTFVAGHTLTSYDDAGRVWAVFGIPGNVARGPTGAHILFATQGFADLASSPPDFILPDGFLPPFAGRICFEDIDCFAWGDFSGNNGSYGRPARRPSVTGVQSFRRTRTTFPLDNSTDYGLGAPTFENNAGESVTLAASDPPCFVTDDFDDLANWDVIAPQAGLDLNACGVPLVADIGSVEVENGRLLLIPGLTDELGLGNPIGIVTLTNAAAETILDQSDHEAYRLRFDMRAELGVVQGAIFVRQHNLFDEGAIDVSEGGGIGLNFTFGCHQPDAPDPCPDGDSDHFHPDFRLSCLQEGDPTRGPREATFSAGLETLEPDMDYTLILDVDGDDVVGPVTLGAKVFPAGGEEPVGYDGFWQSETGLGFPADADFDRAILIAALRSSSIEHGPAFEVSNFSVCAIPRDQRFVRFLECRREVTGAVEITWDNPEGFEDGETRVLIDGEEVDVLTGADNGYLIADPPEADFDVAVVNPSGVPATCSVCKNDPPIVEISGPERVPLAAGQALVSLDASGSTDPEGSDDLLYFWTVDAAPAGARATFDDPAAERVRLTVDREGDYTVSLTVTDAGCPGDEIPQSATATFDFAVGDEPSGPSFRRGDCNTSNSVDLSDAIFWLNHLFVGGPASSCTEACDTNGDGSGDLSDAISLLNYLFTGGATPPAPGPDACGPAPGELLLGCETPAC